MRRYFQGNCFRAVIDPIGWNHQWEVYELLEFLVEGIFEIVFEIVFRAICWPFKKLIEFTCPWLRD